MRKYLPIASLSYLGLVAAAQAAPTPAQNPDVSCTIDDIENTMKSKRLCFTEDVFVLSADEKVNDKFIATDSSVADGSAACTGNAKCAFEGPQAAAAVTRTLEILKSKGINPPPGGWDQVVVFGAEIGPSTDPPGPLFFRNSNMTGPLNDVNGIGLPVNKRGPNDLYTGVIAAGNTASISNPASGAYDPCGKAIAKPTDPAIKQTSPALCYPGAYDFFDALAQATGALYGPYLKSPMADPAVMGATPLNLSVDPSTVTKPALAAYKDQQFRIWNSFLNMKGSLFAGNYWRDNGNLTYETTKAKTYYGVASPQNGTQALRFQPLDLYLLGFLPLDPTLMIQSFMKAVPSDVVVPPNVTTFDANAGPAVGFKTGINIRTKPEILDLNMVVATNGPRDPAPDKAPHFIKQLWIVVTKPVGTVITTAADLKTFNDKQTKAIANVANWRRLWNRYFYMLTGYHGRVITNFEAQDDSGYFEFGSQADDPKMFKPTGMQVDFFHEPATRADAEKATFLTEALVHPTADGFLEYVNVPGQPPLLVDGTDADRGANPNQMKPVTVRNPTNSVAVRMRIPVAAWSGGKPAFASFTLTGGQNGAADFTVKLPNNPIGLLADGKWHTYSANLALPGYIGNQFTGFRFTPASDSLAGDLPIELDSISLAFVDKSADTDTECPKGKMVGKPKPDGWIDSIDNCPTIYNPDQLDSNEDGVGDACEDPDGDGIPSACDNCPIYANSLQRDKNKNNIGDICESSKQGSCFFQPDSLGGPVKAGSPFAAGGLLAVVLGAALVRRRRRR